MKLNIPIHLKLFIVMLIDEDVIYELAENWITEMHELDIVNLSKSNIDDLVNDVQEYLMQEELEHDDMDITTLAKELISQANSYVFDNKEEKRRDLRVDIENLIQDSSDLLNNQDVAYVLIDLAELYLRPEY